MRFFEPADTQPCYYCKKIATEEQEYPIREGIFTLENYVYRCAWHARFTCSKCEKQHHFSWLYWCPKTGKMICGDCKKPILRPVAFWDRTYAYEFHCEGCRGYHFDLLYSEFQGTHPWQLGNRDVISNLESQEPWMPMWSPNKQRDGKKIELAEALKLPNRVMLLREELKYSLYKVLRHDVPEDKIDVSDNQESWELVDTEEKLNESTSELYLESSLLEIESDTEYFITLFEFSKEPFDWTWIIFTIMIVAVGLLSIAFLISKKEYFQYLRKRTVSIEKGAHRLSLEEVLENENRRSTTKERSLQERKS